MNCRCRIRWPCGYTDAGMAAEVICEYLDVEQAALEDTYRLGMAQLREAQQSVEVSR
jgi:hypothetical protein